MSSMGAHVLQCCDRRPGATASNAPRSASYRLCLLGWPQIEKLIMLYRKRLRNQRASPAEWPRIISEQRKDKVIGETSCSAVTLLSWNMVCNCRFGCFSRSYSLLWISCVWTRKLVQNHLISFENTSLLALPGPQMPGFNGVFLVPCRAPSIPFVSDPCGDILHS